ncbi:MAG: FmdB family zinc ribbon protein [Acidiphilium sp.]
MPVYEYECARCGAFEASAPLAAYDQPRSCPGCGAPAPRGIASPLLAIMNGSRRAAFATNEKSANAPETSRRSGRHPSGCGCCKPVVPGGAAKKSFPGTRPWMIGH